jgi:hypothetical protein
MKLASHHADNHVIINHLIEQASLVVPEREKETKIGNRDHQLAVPVSASLTSKINFKFSTQTKDHI